MSININFENIERAIDKGKTFMGLGKEYLENKNANTIAMAWLNELGKKHIDSLEMNKKLSVTFSRAMMVFKMGFIEENKDAKVTYDDIDSSVKIINALSDAVKKENLKDIKLNDKYYKIAEERLGYYFIKSKRDALNKERLEKAFGDR